jgi:hypothetical protein
MKRDDLSRSLVALGQASTLIAVAELSKGSWLVAGLIAQVCSPTNFSLTTLH